jgi:hypothetical protein
LQVILNGPNHPNRKPIGFSTILFTKNPIAKKVQKVQKVQPWKTSRTARTASWAAARRADEGCPGRGPSGQKEGGVRDSEDVRSRRAVRRLMEGQREALDIVRGVLEGEDDVRTDAALTDLQDVLEGTLEDARVDLGLEEGDEL